MFLSDLEALGSEVENSAGVDDELVIGIPDPVAETA